MIISEKINELVLEVARKHADFIEGECRSVCERFNCEAKDLIIEYHDHTLIKIKVMGSQFTMNNSYTINGEE